MNDNRNVYATPPGLPASPAEIVRARYQGRLPSALDELAGPARGTVQLSLHVAWSGQTSFDLDQPKPCMHLYRIVLAEGQRDDVAAYLNRDLLVSQWPVLRMLVSQIVRSVWESAFPELSARRATTAAAGERCEFDRAGILFPSFQGKSIPVIPRPLWRRGGDHRQPALGRGRVDFAASLPWLPWLPSLQGGAD